MLIKFLESAIHLSTTFLFGSTGEIITEKSGHLNLGIPGTMCVGALCGLAGEYWYMSSLPSFDMINGFLAILIPVLTSLLGAGFMGLLYSFLTVTLRSNQNVTGLAITTFGVGITSFFVEKIKYLPTGELFPYSRASTYFKACLPFADDLGWFGQIFLSHGVIVYLAIVVAIVATVILKRTKIGLHLRAVGENPATADAAGINVTAYRYVATVVGSAISGLGGMFYILDYMNGNWEYVIEGMGWLSIALVIFTVWKPSLSIFGSILFSALYIAGSYITGLTFSDKILFTMLPYVVTIIVLIATSIFDGKNSQPPAGLGLNYFREER